MNQSKVCTTCGTQYPAGNAPEQCTICLDDRQYIPEGGQSWTTPGDLTRKSSIRTLQLQDHVYEFTIVPTFAIGQRAFLIRSPNGNVLWDCIPLLNETTAAFIESKGGLKAIAFSHPHYYSNMNDWAERFDCPVYIHRHDEQWIADKGRHITLWNGNEQPLWDGMRLINIGGHFPGSSILHAPSLSPGGTVFCGDTLYLSPSMKHFAVMYSYPNRIPLPLREVERVKQQFDAVPFDTLYGFYSYQNLTENVKEVLNDSFKRYFE